MNPILAAAAFGFLKGLLAKGAPTAERFSSATLHFAGPLMEEIVYRGLPNAVGGRVFPGLSAAVFARDHIVSEGKRYGLSGAPALLRFADVFAGGLLYEKAFREYGLLGSTLAHCLHNLGCTLGRGHK